MINYSAIQDKLGYTFNNPNLLYQALTHSSYVNEIGQSRAASNERLEFLGDSLLGMMVSSLLYNQTPILTEGEMTKLRAGLVCEKSLSSLAFELELGDFLVLGRGEVSSGGRKRPSILADAFEAVIAAIYLDGGLDQTMLFIERVFKPLISKPARSSDDFKTLLQEYIQNKPGFTHNYKLVVQEGPDHNKTFTVAVEINGTARGLGVGRTKKLAQQAAAKEALIYLKLLLID